jgi:polysaccharide export outer membrane protein
MRLIDLRNKRVLAAAVILGLAAGLCAAQDSPVESYRLGAGDRVKITVYGHADLSGEFEVDGEGRISLPLIQQVEALGLTPSELASAIAGKLKPDYLNNPRVSAEVLNYRPFYILGEVNAPGSYAFVNGMTVLNAAAVAGGFTYRAQTGRVVITRGDDENRMEFRAELETKVLPGDVIEIPERFF